MSLCDRAASTRSYLPTVLVWARYGQHLFVFLFLSGRLRFSMSLIYILGRRASHTAAFGNHLTTIICSLRLNFEPPRGHYTYKKNATPVRTYPAMMVTGKGPVDDKGTELFFTDSGPVPGSSNYTTLVICHGSAFTGREHWSCPISS